MLDAYITHQICVMKLNKRLCFSENAKNLPGLAIHTKLTNSSNSKLVSLAPLKDINFKEANFFTRVSIFLNHVIRNDTIDWLCNLSFQWDFSTRYFRSSRNTLIFFSELTLFLWNKYTSNLLRIICSCPQV